MNTATPSPASPTAPLSAREARAVIERHLYLHYLPHTKVSARTVHFTDLARASCVFVRVHGWVPSPAWADVEAVARASGFCVEAQ